MVIPERSKKRSAFVTSYPAHMVCIHKVHILSVEYRRHETRSTGSVLVFVVIDFVSHALQTGVLQTLDLLIVLCIDGL